MKKPLETVLILLALYDREQEILGVYRTRDAAVAAKRAQEKDWRGDMPLAQFRDQVQFKIVPSLIY